MNQLDPSLDERIWSYVRGEGGHSERKKLESEVSSDPTLARRYATIKLLHQRELAHTADKTPAAEAAPKAKPAHPHRDSARHSEHHRPLPKSRFAGMALMAVSLVLVVAGVSVYLARAPWSIETRALARDGVLLGAAIVGVGMAALSRRTKPAPLLAAACGVALASAAAAMLVR